jgi:hypothetical protein
VQVNLAFYLGPGRKSGSNFHRTNTKWQRKENVFRAGGTPSVQASRLRVEELEGEVVI